MSEEIYQGIAMAVYFVAMIGIGFWARRRTTTVSDYMLAGRKLHPVTAALSAGASDMSGWLLMGLPGALYIAGLVEFWIAIGLSVGAWLNWKFVAPRLRAYTQLAGDAITIPSFFGNRLRDSTNALRLTAGVIILVFFTFYVSSGMVAGGKFFDASLGIDYRLGMALVAGVVVLYTLVGGFLAVSSTDLVQGLMMLGALIAVPLAGVVYLGGPMALYDTVVTLDPEAFKLWGATTTVLGVVSSAAWGLGYFGQPHIIVRFMALRTPQEAVPARRIGMGWMILSCLGAAATALVGIAVFKRDEGVLPDPETVFIALGQMLFHPLIAGFLLAAILAAIMSTISSQLLVTASALVEDLYTTFFPTGLTAARGVLMSRAAVLAVSVAAAALAWDQNDTILGLVAFAWAGFGAAFGPTVLLSLYWRRLSTWGALAGMVVGAVTVGVWGTLEGGLFDIYEILPGFLFNLLTALIVSWVTYRRDPELDAEFDEQVRLLAEV